MVSRYSRHPQEAREFMKFQISYEVQKRRFQEGSFLPVLKSVYQDPDLLRTHPHLADFYRIFLNARPRPVTPYYSKLSDILQIQIHRALTGRASPEAALEEASRQILGIPGMARRNPGSGEGSL